MSKKRKKVYRNRRTGEFSSVIPILDFDNWDEVKNPTKSQYKEATEHSLLWKMIYGRKKEKKLKKVV